MTARLTPASRTRDLTARWRAFQAAPAGKPIRVALTATFTIEPVVPLLGAFLAERGLSPTFTVAPFNQLYQSLLAPAGPLRREPADVVVVLPRIEDLCGRARAHLAALTPGKIGEARAEAATEIDRLCEALGEFADATGGSSTLLVGTLPPPPDLPLGVLDGSHPASLRSLYHELSLRLFERVPRVRAARLFDLAALVDRLGSEAAYDMRMWHVARCPFSDAFLRLVAHGLSRAIAPLHLAPAKVVVLDLDDTLWGGVVGEAGPSGIDLGDEGPGGAFVAFQEALLALRSQGVLLAVASKNNEADALQVLDTHPAMRIRREHLAAWRIAWQPKSESLRQLAEELSVGIESLVFVDDNPVECEEVRRLCPEVTVLQLPRDPADYVAALRAVPELDRVVLTDEDYRRAGMYAAERSRAAAGPPHPGTDPAALRDYLASLELRAVVRRLAPAGVPRAAQLTQKTNQFNLTTIRRSEAEVAALVDDPAWRGYSLDAADRFGDYGTVGLVLARQTPDDPGVFLLDTLLLSCRVLGRGIETAFLAAVTGDLARDGASRLLGRFVPTAKNAPAAGFLAAHGFRAQDGDGPLVLDLGEARFDVPHVALTVEAPRELHLARGAP